MSLDVKIDQSKVIHRKIPGLRVQSNVERLIIPFIKAQYMLTEYPEEILGKNLPKEKLMKILSELTQLVNRKKEKERKRWRIFVFFFVTIVVMLVTLVTLVLSYGGQETSIPSVETGKKVVASVFIFSTLLIGSAWIYTGAKGAAENAGIAKRLEEINRIRGVKKYNYMLKFGDHMRWLELHYDFGRYKREEQKRLEEIEKILGADIRSKQSKKKNLKVEEFLDETPLNDQSADAYTPMKKPEISKGANSPEAYDRLVNISSTASANNSMMEGVETSFVNDLKKLA